MEIKIGNRLKHAWNAFMNRDPTRIQSGGYGYRQDRLRLSTGTERSIITSIYNRIAVDAASYEINHVMLDDEKRFKNVIYSSFNDCLNVSANMDQSGRAFIQDAVLSMLDEGCVALVPIDTEDDPDNPLSFKINTIRTGKIISWYSNYVRVRAYNERAGQQEEIDVPKATTAIAENPFYAVMNAYNSTMQRLIRKLNLLDAIDEQSGSGKMNLLIQLPYSVRTEIQKKRAETRKADIENQLIDSKYGIAYIDSTEHVTQLNRSIDNNLMGQIEYLTKMLFSQIGMTQSILDGTANEETMNNYYNRIVKPVLSAVVDEMVRKFLTKTARMEGQSILFFRDPLELVPISKMANIADSLTRNAIVTTNEVRQSIGKKPSSDPRADILENKNIKNNHYDKQEKKEELETDNNSEEENQNE